ncbi:hypothetical protein C2W62_18055 [Candidatus Entotheonella serta]|nr:hypothetical protein C2W62_18055 [Candidatus Entotheonella serta]
MLLRNNSIFGIYSDDNPQTRSLLKQLDLIDNKPFVRVALVTVIGGVNVTPTPKPQRDLDNANTIYQRECGAWVYCVDSRTVDRAELTFLDQDDCAGSGHSVSDEEDQLFDLGRDLGANIVCYYIWSSTVVAGGCAAHPPGRRGFWIGSGPGSSPASPEVAFAHELTHVVGDNSHGSADNFPNNLMNQNQGKPVTSKLTDKQASRILTDVDMENN